MYEMASSQLSKITVCLWILKTKSLKPVYCNARTEDQSIKIKAKMQQCSGFQDTITKTKYCKVKQKQHSWNMRK